MRDKISLITTALSLSLGILITISFPLGYYYLGYQNLSVALETEAAVNARFASQTINTNPYYWRFEYHRLAELLTDHVTGRDHTTRRIMDNHNILIAENDHKVESPVMRRSHNLYDSGQVVGKLEISQSLRPLLQNTFKVGGLALLLAVGIFFTLKVFPLNALSRTIRLLDEEHKRFQVIFASSLIGVALIDREGKLDLVNNAFLQLVHSTADELMGTAFSNLLAPEDSANYNQLFRKVVAGGRQSGHMEVLLACRDGIIAWGNLVVLAVVDNRGNFQYAFAMIEDITGKKQMAEQLQASLQEKKVLLQEIHHRTKNNMQVICALLSLQAKQIKDKNVQQSLAEAQNRIKAMALVHEKLYKSKDLSKIDFGDYIQDLAGSLFAYYQVDQNIVLKIDVKSHPLKLETAIPCGLVLNELIANSLQHAFPPGAAGEIRIAFIPHPDGEMELVVGDNGIGIPSDFNINESPSFGLKVVSMLMEGQLKGKIDIQREHGTEFHLRFKELEYLPRM